ncbi:serine/threonine-protein kinase ZRK1 [Brassica napus]|uniref:serine/threonine-protein kinase ZRK1 n=1 Tax=Brassica napus TaxID=3708 RepID=UPI002079867C|nr:serine/threonine-protein kinase ZRK1 [Brassica napus]
MECWGKKKEKQKEKEKKWFLENGSIFLQQLIADCNGVSNPIRIFSSDQISKATDHFDPKFYLHDIPEAFTWYKAVIEGRSYAIKKFTDKWHQIHPVAPYNDIVLSSRERGEPIEFGGGSNQMRPGQMKMFLDLALRCCEERNEDRPKMISVAKEIKLIETMII